MSHAVGNIFIVQGDYLQQEDSTPGNILQENQKKIEFAIKIVFVKIFEIFI